MTAPGRLFAGLLALLVGLVGMAPALAQDLGDADDPDVRLVLTDVDGVVGPAVTPPPAEDEDDPGPAPLALRLLVENRGDVDVSDLQVVVDVHQSVGGARSLLAQALDEQVVGTQTQTIERFDVREGGDLLAGDIAGLEVEVPGGDIGWAGTNDVYPVEVSVLYGAEVLDRVVTAVVHLQDRDALDRPVRTSVVWPVSAPTTRTSAGRYEEALPGELAPGGRIDQLLSAVERAPDTPLLLAPEAELVEELADRGNGFTLTDGTAVPSDAVAAQQAQDLLERLRAVVEAAPLDPVVGPYGRADVGALVSAPGSLATMAETAVSDARTRTQALLGRAPGNDTYLSTTPLTPSALALLADGTHLLLPSDQVVGGTDLTEDLDVGHALHVVPRLQPGPERVATVADPRVAEVVADPPVDAGLAVVRQRLVAETALLHLTRPAESDRTLLVMPPVEWDPGRGVATAMLSALRDSPWLELAAPQGSISDAVSALDLSTAGAAPPGAVTVELTSAREQLDALRAAMPDELPELDGQTVADLDDALLRALTPEALADGGATALARVRGVIDVTEDAFGEVRLPEDAGVTLTSDTGEVPITLQRTQGGDIDLVVEVTSGAGLVWEDGGQSERITLPEDSSRTVAFGARAAARGTFRVTVSVWDPTRRKLLDTAIVTVRSTAISRTALAVVGGVVLVLLAVGARRRRSPTLEVVR